ncbi:hypothetical protein diail_4362 [Diaporthe ilicicola]|nr:hypothetical protein diail_4362 [Diaporthe ilicicola]
MPVRIAPFRAALHLAAAAGHRTRPPPPTSFFASFFHSSPALRRDDIDSKNHYEILEVPTGAPPKDIKKSFYHLSKTHHPDHNQDDPLASKRFMRISEAYSVLSNTDRRAKYDRDVLRLHEQRASAGPHRGGSYSSTGPAGGRPASGLSRRRGTFRGPPPSFYRSGGWGAHGAKRSQAHEDSTSGTDHAHHHHHQHQHQHRHHQHPSPGANGYGSSGGGAGPGQEPFGGVGGGDMPHFDQTAKAAHTRTQSRVDEIRARNAAKKPRFPSASGDYGEIGSFFAVLGVLGAAVGLPYLVMRGWDRTTEKKKKTKSERARTAAG